MMEKADPYFQVLKISQEQILHLQLLQNLAFYEYSKQGIRTLCYVCFSTVVL